MVDGGGDESLVKVRRRRDETWRGRVSSSSLRSDSWSEEEASFPSFFFGFDWVLGITVHYLIFENWMVVVLLFCRLK